MGYRGVSVVDEPPPAILGILLFIWNKNEDDHGKELMDDENSENEIEFIWISKAVICAPQRYYDQSIGIFERPLVDDQRQSGHAFQKGPSGGELSL